MFLQILSFLILTGALLIAFQWLTGVRKLPVIDSYSSQISLRDTPFVSIVIAARNEEKYIYQTVVSLLEQQYPHYELIVVNDRSEDKTLDFLEDIKQTHHRRHQLRIMTISSLPQGWLGKNHALYQGAKAAKGEWLLFTDGDVLFSEKTLAKAVGCIEKNQLDHLTVIPENIGGTLPYRAFHSYWSILGVWNFVQLKHAGIGAFNMIRSKVYSQIGTHEALSMSPDDDLKLGKRIKNKGFRQLLGFGKNLISIQWYETIPQVIAGLEKNLFAFMRYNLWLAGLFTGLLFLFHLLPFIGVILQDGLTRGFFAATIAVYAAMYIYNRSFVKDSPWFFLWMPINGLLFIFCLLRSTFKALKNKGIEWRGTHYSLKELREKLKADH